VTADEFDSEFSVDAALKDAFDRFDRVMTRAERARRPHASVNACVEILGPVATRDIENAATWAHYGPEYGAHAERARVRAGYGDEQLAADSR
jgi:hypothetical protein